MSMWFKLVLTLSVVMVILSRIAKAVKEEKGESTTYNALAITVALLCIADFVTAMIGVWS